jgi:hypothetical protein
MKNAKKRARKAAARKRTVPHMPKGCHSVNKPNPNLRAFVVVHLQEQSVPKKRLLPRLIQYPGDLFPIIFCSVFVLVV